jgi:aminoacyl tRNA synthase complex-interacting multifunctional protein 1
VFSVKKQGKTDDKKQKQTQTQKQKGGDQKQNKAQPTAKKDAPQKQPAAEAKEETINPSILDMRVGRVLSVRKHEKADKLLIEEIDVGEEQPRTICSGLVGKIAIEDIMGKDVLVMCNLKPSNMVGVPSNGMVVASTNKETGEVELVKIPENTYKVGERISVEGFEGNPATPTQMSKKLGKVLPLLSTNDKGEVVFNGTARFKTSGGGILYSKFTNAEVK